MATDYYELLGVSRTATAEEVKKAYRRLARELHPDANPDDPEAEARFKEVAVAYETLSDPERRRRYDMFGADGAARGGDQFGFGAAGGLNDLFDAFFGRSPFAGDAGGRSGPPQGSDIEATLDLEFTTAVFGGEASLTVRTAVPCVSCEATGAEKGSHAASCSACNGTGQVRRVRQSILGQMVTAGPCSECGGWGHVITHPCADCKAEGRRIEDKTYVLDVPAGIDTGATLRLSGRGAVGPRGGPYGDLYVHVRVEPHPYLERQGYDLVHELHLPVTQAALGVELDYESLDGAEQLDIPRGTHTGQVFRLRGRGVPYVEGRGRGDLLVKVVVDTPDDLDREQEELLRRLAELRGDKVAPVDESLLSKIRSAFK